MQKLKYIVFAIFFIGILGVVGNSIYLHVNKKTAKSYRISCHKTTTTFEKILDKKQISSLQNALKNGDFSLHVKELPSKYMPSKLFLHVSKNEVEKTFKSLFLHSKTKKPNAHVEIFIYENDKLDPKKKTKKSKLYEGYLLFDFAYKEKIIYKLQLDFYDKHGKDIPTLLKCAKDSIYSVFNVSN